MITNNVASAANPPIFDHDDSTTVRGNVGAVTTPASMAVQSSLANVELTSVTQPTTSEPRKMTAQTTVVSGPVVSAGGADSALPTPVGKDLIIRPFAAGGPTPIPGVRFITFYHPLVCDFIKLLNQGGIPGLLTLDTQKLVNYGILPNGTQVPKLQSEYNPNSNYVNTPYPQEDVNFDFGGAYSLYNWELFFHIPMLIATRLSKNQRFEEAQHWFHYIFNPTDSSSEEPPKRYWKVLPFQTTENERIQDLLALLHYTGYDPQMLEQKKQLDKQVQEWRANPFNPHLIARLRLIAY